MKHIILLLFVFLLSTCLNATESYSQLLITKTSKKSNLRLIKHKLDTIYIKMYVKRKGSSFYIYSEKFTNENKAQTALQKVRRYFKYAQKIDYAQKTDLQKSSLAKKQDSDKKMKREKKNFFVNFAFGLQNTSGGDSSSGSSYALEAGYVYDKELSTTLTYLSSSSSDISANYIYTALNYNFNITQDMNIRTGGLFGYSTLQKSGFTQSNSILFGVQAQYLYTLYDFLDIYTAYQGIYLDHVIQVSSTKTLEFNFMHNLQFGLSYKF